MPRVQWLTTRDGQCIRTSFVYALDVREAVGPGSSWVRYQVRAYVNPNAATGLVVDEFEAKADALAKLDEIREMLTDPTPSDTLREAAAILPGLLAKLNGAEPYLEGSH